MLKLAACACAGAGLAGATPLTVRGRRLDGAGDSNTDAPGMIPAGRAGTDAASRRGVPGRRWIMVIDLAVCEGCAECTRACSKMHGVPQGQDWLPVLELRDGELAAPYNFPKPCFHCDNPPCTKVCPVDATFKRDDGIVLIDPDRCIGCRFCMVACPYSTRHFSWSPAPPGRPVCNGPGSPEYSPSPVQGTVQKCDFCPNLAERGVLPVCVTSCPHGVIYYGDQNEDAVTNGLGVTVQLSRLLEERAGSRYLEELDTRPRVYYLPPRDRQFPARSCQAHPGGDAGHSMEAP